MWDYFVAFLFGLVEGVTEWLPVSSTGHMILLNEFFKLNVSKEFYDLYLVVIQLGAILAVVIIFWWDIWPFGIKRNEHPLSKSGVGRYVMKDKFIMWFKILIACIPAAIVGVLFDDILDKYLYNYVCVAIALIVFGVAFIVVEYLNREKEPKIKKIGQLNYGHAFAIGLFQLLAAIFPGTSRSGSTIVGSIAIGISREAAAKFTFFLAIPVMFGASLLKILKYDGDCSIHEITLLGIGMVTAFVVSMLIIKGLMAFIRKHSFTCFGWYRIALGILVLVLGAMGIIGK
ncbi:MAG: undecaprenyl-diphosphate phosphatase [Saccharofermentans sp.]|nr:undecaprenyl-diphosphate phosphatase [Saccharofermentans sp.]